MSDTYEFHEIANKFPLLKEEDPRAFAELVEDIKSQGLLNEIVIYQNKILDGRNRYLACIEAEKEPRFKSYRDDDPISFVISNNIKRRHLTISQCAGIAADLANMNLGDNQYGEVGSSNERPPEKPVKTRISQADAAKKMNVSQAQVKRAARVKKEDPKAFEDIKKGKITVGGAERKLREKTAPAKPQAKPAAKQSNKKNTLEDFRKAYAYAIVEAFPIARNASEEQKETGKNKRQQEVDKLLRRIGLGE